MRNLKDLILEKLKISKKTLSSNEEYTVEVPYYEFVIWYTGFLNKKPDEITEFDFKRSGFVESIVDSNGFEVFVNSVAAYDFYTRRKDDIVMITIEKLRGPVGNDGGFWNIIDFGDEVFYADSREDFREYLKDK